MALSLLDTRELKSFRLLNKTKQLRIFFETPDNFGIFVSSDSLHPNERIQLRNEFIQQKLEITQLSNNISNLIFNKEEWEEIQKLLTGQAFFIRDLENKGLNEEKLRFILDKNKFSIRFIIWNQQIYRNADILQFLNRAQAEKQSVVLLQTLTAQLVKTAQLLHGLSVKSNQL